MTGARRRHLKFRQLARPERQQSDHDCRQRLGILASWIEHVLHRAEAIDPRGETQAYGLGLTPAEARAGAWINVWWEECDLRAVPRSVPEGWMFEIYPPGEGMLFRRTTVQL